MKELEKNLEKIKNEIEKFGFFIFEVPDEIRKKYFLEFVKKNSIQIKSIETLKNRLKFFLKISFFVSLIFFVIFLFSAFILFLKGVDFYYIFDFFKKFFLALLIIILTFFIFLFIFGFLFTLLPIIFVGFLRNLLKFFQNSSYENINGLGEKYILFSEKYIFIKKRFYDFGVSDLDLKKNFFGKIFEKENVKTLEISKEDLEIMEKLMGNLNKNQRKIYILFQDFGKIKENISILKEKQKTLENLFSEDKEKIFLRFVEIEKNIKNIGKIIEESFIYKEKVKKSLKNLGKKDFINFEKYDLWLKNNLLLPVKNMKNILENHKNFIEKLLVENKENKSEQILVLNKRLELQKETLANNILLLDEKIFALENNF